MKRIVFLLLAVGLLTACINTNSDEPKKRGSSGKTLELLVVADPEVYRGDTKELVDSLLAGCRTACPSQRACSR